MGDALEMSSYLLELAGDAIQIGAAKGDRSKQLEIPLTERNARSSAEQFLFSLLPYPTSLFSGRGIVICAGGYRYLKCAWVCIHMLRKLNCELPIELWHLNEAECDERMRRFFTPLGVDCIDAEIVRKTHPVRILNGWELKPYSITHSKFKEVLLIDADNVPIINPHFLFEAPEYLRTGAVFWPDAELLKADRKIWEICGVTPRTEQEFESGQILVNKKCCWRALRLTLYMNEHSDFYYRYVHGDKETYHLAWRMLEQEFAMVPIPIHRLKGVICQHDFEGRRIFQHRSVVKWDPQFSRHIDGFEYERECWELCDQFDDLYKGVLWS